MNVQKRNEIFSFKFVLPWKTRNFETWCILREIDMLIRRWSSQCRYSHFCNSRAWMLWAREIVINWNLSTCSALLSSNWFLNRRLLKHFGSVCAHVFHLCCHQLSEAFSDSRAGEIKVKKRMRELISEAINLNECGDGFVKTYQIFVN